MGEKCCNSNKENSCEHKESCCNHEHHCEFLKFLLEVADCAWKEALKEKIKEHILATQGDRMAELAKIVSETNNERWKHKMQKKRGLKDFKERLSHFFGEGK